MEPGNPLPPLTNLPLPHLLELVKVKGGLPLPCVHRHSCSPDVSPWGGESWISARDIAFLLKPVGRGPGLGVRSRDWEGWLGMVHLSGGGGRRGVRGNCLIVKCFLKFPKEKKQSLEHQQLGPERERRSNSK